MAETNTLSYLNIVTNKEDFNISSKSYVDKYMDKTSDFGNIFDSVNKSYEKALNQSKSDKIQDNQTQKEEPKEKVKEKDSQDKNEDNQRKIHVQKNVRNFCRHLFKIKFLNHFRRLLTTGNLALHRSKSCIQKNRANHSHGNPNRKLGQSH